MKVSLKLSMIGVCISVVITVLCLFIMAFISYQFHVDRKMVDIFITITYMISCFAGGMIAGKHQEKKYLKGFAVGNIYYGILIGLSLFLHKDVLFLQDSRTIVVATICSISGMLGGMLA